MTDAPLVLPLEAVDPTDPDTLGRVGGKAANLGALVRAGFAVPAGVCLTTAAYRRAVGSALDGLLSEHDTGALAEQARAAVLAVPIPDEVADAVRATCPDGPVAVRSSATAEDLPDASFAGQQDTFLNVVGDDAVLDAVRRCWASLWTDRAVAYRGAHGIDHAAVTLAVVIQSMVDARWAGVLFTADPVTGRRGQAVIDAAPGLGESVVSGSVDPEHLVVDPGGEIVSRHTGAGGTVVRARGRRGHRDRGAPERCGLPGRRRRADPRPSRPPGRGALRRAAGHRVGPGRRRPRVADPVAADHDALPARARAPGPAPVPLGERRAGRVPAVHPRRALRGPAPRLRRRRSPRCAGRRPGAGPADALRSRASACSSTSPTSCAAGWAAPGPPGCSGSWRPARPRSSPPSSTGPSSPSPGARPCRPCGGSAGSPSATASRRPSSAPGRTRPGRGTGRSPWSGTRPRPCPLLRVPGGRSASTAPAGCSPRASRRWRRGSRRRPPPGSSPSAWPPACSAVAPVPASSAPCCAACRTTSPRRWTSRSGTSPSACATTPPPSPPSPGPRPPSSPGSAAPGRRCSPRVSAPSSPRTAAAPSPRSTSACRAGPTTPPTCSGCSPTTCVSTTPDARRTSCSPAARRRPRR